MLLLLLACQPAHTPSSTESPPTPASAEAPPTPARPETPPTATQVMTVTLNPKYLRYDDAKGIATFSPDSDRQMADYTTYLIDLASLEAALGGRPSAPVEVTLEIRSTTVERSTPADNMPSPSGGFTYTTHAGRVIAKGK